MNVIQSKIDYFSNPMKMKKESNKSQTLIKKDVKINKKLDKLRSSLNFKSKKTSFSTHIFKKNGKEIDEIEERFKLEGFSENFFINLTSINLQNKYLALLELNKNFSKNLKFQKNLEIFIVYFKEKTKNFSESNLQFNEEFLDFLKNILNDKNSMDTKFFLLISPIIIERLEEIHFFENILFIIKKYCENLGYKFILTNFLSLANNNTNSTILVQCCNLLVELSENNVKRIYLKEIIDFAKICANHSNPEVKSASVSLFLVFFKNIGKIIIYCLQI